MRPPHAKLYRNALCGLFAAVALGCFQVAHAGYAQLANPAGFTTAGGGFGYAAAANDLVFDRVIHQPNGLTANVAGQAVKMPASYRLAANAPRIAAAAIFANPALRVGVGIAGWLLTGKVVWDAAEGIWREFDEQGTGTGYKYSHQYAQNTWFSSAGEACANLATNFNTDPQQGNAYSLLRIAQVGGDTQCVFRVFNVFGFVQEEPYSLTKKEVPTAGCPAGWTASPAGCLSPALTQPQMVELLNPANQPGWPMPSTVPKELPGVPLPVEQPYINPAPGPSPAHRPQFVPMGDPVKNPNYDPTQAPSPTNQPYIQPGVRVNPSPTPDAPWRVDMQPVDRPVGTQDPQPEPQPDPEPNPNDQPKPEEQKSLCEKHPDILACAKPELDTPDGEIPKATREITYQEQDVFGGGSCPADKYATIGGRSMMVYDWQQTCGVVSTYLRPLILLLGAMGALFILIPGRDS